MGKQGFYTKIIEHNKIKAKIETLEFLLSYFCKSELSNKARQDIKKMINEYKMQINETD